MSKNKENQYFLTLSPVWIVTDSAVIMTCVGF